MTPRTRKQTAHPGPDFLCIGLQKAGTGFLYDCLQTLDAFRLPPRKEIHHFDAPEGGFRGNRQFLMRMARALGFDTDDEEGLLAQFRSLRTPWFGQPRVIPFDRPIVLDRANVEFTRRFSQYVLADQSDPQYLALFEPFRRWISGDITPAYSTLDPEQVRAVNRLLPDARFVFIVRDPVGRLWSQLGMELSWEFRKIHGRIPRAGDEAEFQALPGGGRLETMLRAGKYARRSFPTRIYETWRNVAGERLLVVHFDDLIRRTPAVLDRVGKFLGAGPQAVGELPQNRKAKAIKLELTDEYRAALAAYLGDEIEAFRRAFDEHPDRV